MTSTPITIHAPPPLITDLHAAADTAGMSLQRYCIIALEAFIERYAHQPHAIPAPLVRPSPRHPSITVRGPKHIRARLNEIKRALNDRAEERGESTTIAALVLLAYLQALRG